jgi:hypothetical protein
MPSPPLKQVKRQKLKKLHRNKSKIPPSKLTLSNTQIEAIKVYIKACEYLNTVGLTVYDVLEIIAMHKIEWGEGLAAPSLGGEQRITEGYVQLFPDEAIKLIKNKLGKKKKKTKRKSKGKNKSNK